MKGSSGHGAIVRRTGSVAHRGAHPVGLGACTDLRRSRWRGASAGARIARWIAGASWRCSPRESWCWPSPQRARHPDLAPGGGSRAALALQLAAGLALVAAAMHTARRDEPAVAAALLIAAAGLALGVLPEPPEGAVLFTLALVGAGLPAAAAAHAALAVSRRALRGVARPRRDRGRLRHDRRLLGCAALVFDPPQAGCFDCPDNLLLVHADPGGERLAGALDAARRGGDRGRARRAGRRAAAAAAAAAARARRGAGLRRRRRRAGARRRSANARDGPTSLWLATCAALAALAAGFAWRPLRARAGPRAS